MLCSKDLDLVKTEGAMLKRTRHSEREQATLCRLNKGTWIDRRLKKAREHHDRKTDNNNIM